MNIELDASPVYLRNYESTAFVTINQGGARSGKTYSVLQCLVFKHALPSQVPITIDIVRKEHSTIKATVQPDLEEILQNTPWGDQNNTLWDITKKVRNEYRINHAIIRLIGIDKAQKKRGAKRNILFINEANELSLEDWKQLQMRTSDKIYIDYNPSEEFWVHTEVFDNSNFVLSKSRDLMESIVHQPYVWDTSAGKKIRKITYEFIQSTYLDNYDFLSEGQILAIESLIGQDPYYEDVYVHGKLGTVQGRIYNDWNEISYQNYTSISELPFYGIDVGYEHYMVLIEVKYHQEQVYEKILFFERFKHDTDLIKFMMKADINLHSDIYVDPSAKSTRIKLRDKGFSARKANNAVADGLRFCKSLKRNIVKDELGERYIKQLRQYKHKQTADGHFVEGVPVKIKDDGPDAMRYAEYTHLKYDLDD